MKEPCLNLTRERHLDHMVRVIPLIVMCYAFQCWAILGVKNNPLGTTFMSISGCCLAFMIFSFIFYDLKHQVVLHQDHLRIKFLFVSRVVYFSDISEIRVSDPEGSFSNLTISHNGRKSRFFFADQAPVLKEWIEARRDLVKKAA